jgi:hypothetical protein
VRRDKAALSSGCVVVEQRNPRIRGPPKMLLQSILATLEKALGALIDRQRSAGYLEIRRRNGRCWRKAVVQPSDDVGEELILLQKSKVASVQIFGEILKHETIDDSDNLSRATEFSVRR